jgi:hydrogenase nickel incorporation protein HypA/HybF
MHEYGIVRDLVERLLPELRSRGIRKVQEVRLRRSSTFAEQPLRQAFEMVAPGTPLEGARLAIEEFSERVACAGCGRERDITADDLIGHLYVCPDCGVAREVDEAHGLEVLGVTGDAG